MGQRTCGATPTIAGDLAELPANLSFGFFAVWTLHIAQMLPEVFPHGGSHVGCAGNQVLARVSGCTGACTSVAALHSGTRRLPETPVAPRWMCAYIAAPVRFENVSVPYRCYKRAFPVNMPVNDRALIAAIASDPREVPDDSWLRCPGSRLAKRQLVGSWSSEGAPGAVGDLVMLRRVGETTAELRHDEIGCNDDAVALRRRCQESVKVGAKIGVGKVVDQIEPKLRIRARRPACSGAVRWRSRPS